MSFDIIEPKPVTSLLEDAQAAFDGYRAAIAERIKLLAASDNEDSAAAVQKQIAELNRVLSIAVAETRKVEDERNREINELGRGEFDLDAARLEIRSRLARIRDAHGGGDLSGELE